MKITLPDYKIIAKKFYKENTKNLDVPEAKFEEAILWLRRSRAQYIALNRPIEVGDVADIDFDTTVGLIPLEGGAGRKYLFMLGKGKFVPGFEERITGMQIGEKRAFDVAVPEDYWLTDLCGKSLHFSVTMNNIQKEVLPDFNEEFAKTLGGFKDSKDIEDNIRRGLSLEQNDREIHRLRLLLLDALAKETKADIEEEMITKEVERVFNEFKRGGPAQANVLNYLAQFNKTEEDFKKELRPEAERNITIALLLGRIAVEEKIVVEESEVEGKIEELKKYPSTSSGQENPEEKIQDEDLPSMRLYVKNMLATEKVLTFLEQQ
ncbi:MAG: trigger factor [Parcubacteria group bacterium]|nr:trigger factor [Parcubacteria group bacterium]